MGITAASVPGSSRLDAASLPGERPFLWPTRARERTDGNGMRQAPERSTAQTAGGKATETNDSPFDAAGVPRALWWDDVADGLRLLDQTLLPARCEVTLCRDAPSVAAAIRTLRVRGAPAIGIAAAFGLALGAR